MVEIRKVGPAIEELKTLTELLVLRTDFAKKQHPTTYYLSDIEYVKNSLKPNQF